MNLTKEEVKSLKELVQEHSEESSILSVACGDLFDTLQAKEEEIEQHITWNEAHTKARVEQARQKEQLQKDLLIKREAVAGLGRLCRHYEQEIAQKDEALRLAKNMFAEYECECGLYGTEEQCGKCYAITAIEKALGR